MTFASLEFNFPVFETGPKGKADVADLFKKVQNTIVNHGKL